VSNNGGSTVTVIGGATNTVTATIAVGAGPEGVAVNARRNVIYVANASDGTLTVSKG
jgi:YVTN family beta-propeller protein